MRTIRIAVVLGVITLLGLVLSIRSSLLAQQQPILQVSPASLSFEGQVDGPTPDPQFLTIANTGGGLMEWHASKDAEWIILGASGGKLSGGRAIQLLVLVDIEGLAAGEYQGTITIAAPGAQGSPVVVSVILTLTQPAYTVCPSGCRYSSIAEAIAAARSGATIIIYPGTYEENLTITKSLILKGAGRDRTGVKIKAREGGEPVIRIESDSEIEVTLEGLTIAEAKGLFADRILFAAGIRIGGKAKVIVRNSLISGNYDDGISMGGSSQATISGSTISGNGGDGIRMALSSRATIRDNEIFENEGYGVALNQRPCFDTDLKFEGQVEGSGNEIHDNGWGDVCPEELEFLRTEEGGQYP